MGRHIKFRIWDKQERRMLSLKEDITVSLGGLSGGDVQVVFGEDFHSDFCEGEVTDFDLLEWTGVQDKNGIAIYEGDIIRIPGNFVSYPTHVAVVEWSERELGWISSTGLRLQNSGGPPQLEVLGNNYEHPSLLDALRLQEKEECRRQE